MNQSTKPNNSEIERIREEIKKDIKIMSKEVEIDILSGNSFIILSHQTNYWNLKALNERLVELKGFNLACELKDKEFLDKIEIWWDKMGTYGRYMSYDEWKELKESLKKKTQ